MSEERLFSLHSLVVLFGASYLAPIFLARFIFSSRNGMNRASGTVA